MIRLEDIDYRNVSMLEDRELFNLRERADQAYRTSKEWAKALQKRIVGVTHPIKRDVLLEIYQILLIEMKKRGLKPKNVSVLDSKITRKKLRDIDVAEFPPIMVSEKIVCLTGPFVKSPKQTDTVTVRVDAEELDDTFTQELEKQMVESVMSQTSKSVIVRHDAIDLDGPVIPIYDLVLVPRSETLDDNDNEDLIKRLEKRNEAAEEIDSEDEVEEIEKVEEELQDGLLMEFVDISKPFPNEHASRQLSPGQFDDIRSGKPKGWPAGVRALFGIKGGKSKIQSIRFRSNLWTVERAKEWLKSHGFKTALEAATDKVKKIDDIETSFIKNEEQRIVGGLVYTVGSVNDVDGQGDFCDDPAEIFKAMKSWALSGHVMKFMHEGLPVDTPVIECFQPDQDIIKSGTKIPAGAWYISNYVPEEAEDLWQAIKRNEVSGYSMSGSALAEEII